jgi:hypothetical protein
MVLLGLLAVALALVAIFLYASNNQASNTNNKVGGNCADDRSCLLASFTACTPASFFNQQSTIEGDPITTSAKVQKKAQGGCELMVVVDNSKDKFGDGLVSELVCTKLAFSDDRSYLKASGCTGKYPEIGI